ncbi:serine/threonine-protein kinase dst1 [Phalaenopsis equestris]|uniref:serine/threonine-protein kinase dst1 n=1 Tax=Phalaenopsis equestris TaxID=78828 RepID=UPI0009E38179|nr:serine/threonine-protein kinase dst1 [Phalaenopsis equestris]
MGGRRGKQSDIFSTVVIHGDDGSDPEIASVPSHGPSMGTVGDDGDEVDASSLPPLLQRLPKDFDDAAGYDDDYEEDMGASSELSGTFIVKQDRPSASPHSARRPLRSPFFDFNRSSPRARSEPDDAYSTFVVRSTTRSRGALSPRETLSGTFVRKTGLDGAGFGSSFMSEAGESMKAASEGDEGRLHEPGQHLKRRASVSSVPDSVNREDPTTKYELLHELGKGSYGAVYKARDLKTSELVAIKVISLTEGEEGYDEIRGEIEMLQQCSHPNVVRYFGSYQGEEYLWIVMEYCGGGSVADLMSVTEEPLNETQIAYICREALKGLAYLHSIFKVHRDIKGGNILLTEQGEVKLGDFGVAAQLTRTMSKRNTFIGTPHWMAPEVIQESRYDGKVDVWALGVSAIEMAERLPPRSSVHPMRVLFMISREPAPMLEDKEKWSLLFHDFIAKCLTKDPRLRPPATEMLKHKFIERGHWGASKMLPMIKRARQIRSAMAAQPQAQVQAQAQAATIDKSTIINRSYGDTVPSKPQKTPEAVHKVPEGCDSSQLTNYTELGSAKNIGDYGTVVVHSEGGSSQDSNKQDISLDQSDSRRVLKHDFGGKSTQMWVENSTGTIVGRQPDTLQIYDSQSTQDSSPSYFGMPGQKPDTGNASQVNGTITNAAAVSTFKAATIGRKGLSIQDKLWSICAAGNTVPIPFLKAIDISPLALVSDNIVEDRVSGVSGSTALEAVKELCSGDGQMKKGRRGTNEVSLPPGVYQRLTTSPTLMNLAQALAYHKTCYEDMPLQELQAAQEQQTIQNICDTLRTILRL